MAHHLKVANPATLSGTLPFLGGAARRAAGGMIMPPNGVQGQRPWHAFGDFRRETKVTRGAGRSARISWAAGAHAPAPALPGERSTPFTYTPKSPKSCIPTCNRTERKIKKELWNEWNPPTFHGGIYSCESFGF